jgi:UDP-2-acetamido-3-amino-2,3-dideoxy-glucuronate N-acetyltransferase
MWTRTAQIIGSDPQRSALSAGLSAHGWTLTAEGEVVFFVDAMELTEGRRVLAEGRHCVLLGPPSRDDGALHREVTADGAVVWRAPPPAHTVARARWHADVESGQLGPLTALHFETFAPIPTYEVAPDALSAALTLVDDPPERVEALGTPPQSTVQITFGGGLRALFTQHHTPNYAASRWTAMGPLGVAVFEGLPGQPGRHSLRIAGGRTHVSEPAEDDYGALSDAVTTAFADLRLARWIPNVLAAVSRAEREKRSATVTSSSGAGYFLHHTVDVDGEVEIGEETRVWHFSKLLGPLRIGARCSLGQNVVVERNVVIGDNVKIQNNVSVYSGVILEDDVFCGPSMVFTNVGTPRSHYPRKGQYITTRVRRGASIGANATVICGHTLGRYCFIGAGAVVTRDVPDFALVYGNPARIRGWACYCGARLPLGVSAGLERGACPQCDRAYARDDHCVRLLDEEKS